MISTIYLLRNLQLTVRATSAQGLEMSRNHASELENEEQTLDDVDLDPKSINAALDVLNRLRQSKSGGHLNDQVEWLNETCLPQPYV